MRQMSVAKNLLGILVAFSILVIFNFIASAQSPYTPPPPDLPPYCTWGCTGALERVCVDIVDYYGSAGYQECHYVCNHGHGPICNPPPPPPPEFCEDPAANNFGGLLPCVYGGGSTPPPPPPPSGGGGDTGPSGPAQQGTLKLCAQGIPPTSPNCSILYTITEGDTVRFYAWFLPPDGTSWTNVTNDVPYISLCNEGSNNNLPDNDWNNLGSDPLFRTCRGLRFEPYGYGSGPYEKGRFRALRYNSNACLTSGSGCPPINSNYGGVGAQIGLRVIPTPPPPPPFPVEVSLSANPTTVTLGQSSTLTWSATNSSSCIASNWWSGSKSTSSGSESVSPPAIGTYTYSLTCFGSPSGNELARSVTVTATAPLTPTVTLNVDPATINQGASSAITWSSTNVTSCTGTNFSTGGLTSHTSPGVQVFPPTTTTYTIQCTGPGGSVSDSKTVTVNAVGAFDYSLSRQQSVVNVTKVSGGNAFTQNVIVRTHLDGLPNTVTLRTQGLPTTILSRFSPPNPFICSTSCTSTLELEIPPSVIPGSYSVTVIGTTPAINPPVERQTTPFTLNILPSASDLTVQCSVTPTSVLLGQPVTWRADVTGGAEPLTYLWSGNVPSPAPTSQFFTTSYTTIGTKSATVLVTDATGVRGTCQTIPTVMVNFNPQFEEF